MEPMLSHKACLLSPSVNTSMLCCYSSLLLQPGKHKAQAERPMNATLACISEQQGWHPGLVIWSLISAEPDVCHALCSLYATSQCWRPIQGWLKRQGFIPRRQLAVSSRQGSLQRSNTKEGAKCLVWGSKRHWLLVPLGVDTMFVG